MKGSQALYKGKIINKDNFAAFVYGSKGERKLVKSWDQYQDAIQSGIWFSSLKEAIPASEVAPEAELAAGLEAIKQKRKYKPRKKADLDQDDVVEKNDGAVFEVKPDDAGYSL